MAVLLFATAVLAAGCGTVKREPTSESAAQLAGSNGAAIAPLMKPDNIERAMQTKSGFVCPLCPGPAAFRPGRCYKCGRSLIPKTLKERALARPGPRIEIDLTLTPGGGRSPETPK